KNKPPDNTCVIGIATACILLQMAFMYLFTAILKSGAPWHITFDALTHALRNKEFSTDLGQYLAQFESINRVLTFGTYWLEILCVLSLFSPWKTMRLRALATVLLVLLHLGIVLTMNVGTFSITSIA